jgi:hypothetical protein
MVKNQRGEAMIRIKSRMRDEILRMRDEIGLRLPLPNDSSNIEWNFYWDVGRQMNPTRVMIEITNPRMYFDLPDEQKSDG